MSSRSVTYHRVLLSASRLTNFSTMSETFDEYSSFVFADANCHDPKIFTSVLSNECRPHLNLAATWEIAFRHRAWRTLSAGSPGCPSSSSNWRRHALWLSAIHMRIRKKSSTPFQKNKVNFKLWRKKNSNGTMPYSTTQWICNTVSWNICKSATVPCMCMPPSPPNCLKVAVCCSRPKRNVFDMLCGMSMKCASQTWKSNQLMSRASLNGTLEIISCETAGPQEQPAWVSSMKRPGVKRVLVLLADVAIHSAAISPSHGWYWSRPRVYLSPSTTRVLTSALTVCVSLSWSRQAVHLLFDKLCERKLFTHSAKLATAAGSTKRGSARMSILLLILSVCSCEGIRHFPKHVEIDLKRVFLFRSIV